MYYHAHLRSLTINENPIHCAPGFESYFNPRRPEDEPCTRIDEAQTTCPAPSKQLLGSSPEIPDRDGRQIGTWQDLPLRTPQPRRSRRCLTYRSSNSPTPPDARCLSLPLLAWLLYQDEQLFSCTDWELTVVECCRASRTGCGTGVLLPWLRLVRLPSSGAILRPSCPVGRVGECRRSQPTMSNIC